MKKIIAAVAITGALLAASLPASAAKNVIFMISDGMGYNQLAAANYHTGTTQAYQNFSFKSAMSTYSYNRVEVGLGYNPSTAWIYDGQNAKYINVTEVTNKPTDSASAMTAMMTGIKNYDGAVNVMPGTNAALKTFAQYAAEAGKATGAISTVEFSHATPAAVAAHNTSRNNYSAIANEMIYNSDLDVIMGAGHPLYDDSGVLKTSGQNYNFVGGQSTWNDLTDGSGANSFSFIDQKSQFEALANGTLSLSKVVGVAQAATTTQQGRSNTANSYDPMNSNVPGLGVMAKGALNVLSQDQDGFFLMIEGGAVDWAGHANQSDRVIEEQMDFNNAVDTVIAWINGNGGWDQNMLIVTGDHETGLLASSVKDGFNNPMPNITGESDMAWYSSNHTNGLVPFFCQGAGSEVFGNYIVGTDPVRGGYIDNTAIFNVMKETSVPEPGSILALGSGLIGLVGFTVRRRK